MRAVRGFCEKIDAVAGYDIRNKSRLSPFVHRRRPLFHWPGDRRIFENVRSVRADSSWRAAYRAGRFRCVTLMFAARSGQGKIEPKPSSHGRATSGLLLPYRRVNAVRTRPLRRDIKKHKTISDRQFPVIHDRPESAVRVHGEVGYGHFAGGDKGRNRGE